MRLLGIETDADSRKTLGLTIPATLCSPPITADEMIA
jgi:hypothetical protein